MYIKDFTGFNSTDWLLVILKKLILAYVRKDFAGIDTGHFGYL